MELWWSRPERLEYELQALEEAGFRFEDPGDLTRSGPITFRVYAQIGGTEIPFDVTFPEPYPYFRFVLVAPTLSLEHHQNPFSKSLCLIGRVTENWDPHDTLAAFLRERVPQVIEAGQAEERAEVEELEEHQAEPVSEFYPYTRDAIVLIDGSWRLPPDFREGEVVIGLSQPAGLLIRGAVLEVRTRGGDTLVEADPEIANLYKQMIRGRLIRSPRQILEDNPVRFLEAATERRLEVDLLRWHGVQGGRISVMAVIFPEEVAWRESGEGWIFVVGAEEVQSAPDQHGKKAKGKQSVRRQFYFARAGRAGREDFILRAPELRPLRHYKIAAFGLGCIGAPSALEFARAGAEELRILDRDYVDPAAVLRWPYGLIAAGLTKTTVIEQVIRANYPYTRVDPHNHTLGGDEGDLEVLGSMLAGASLVYDAMAEIGIQHFLSDAARAQGIPYIAVSGTQGGWGGLVVRIRPDGDAGCWYCFRRAQLEGRIPPAPHDPGGVVQPAGCGDPTFMGASFDLVSVALAGVRTAVATLSGPEGGYPDGDWDVLVITFRDPAGNPVPPNFQEFKIPKYPDCPSCAANTPLSGSRGDS